MAFATSRTPRAIARFKALAAPIEAELGRALSNSSGPKPLVDAMGQWKASALILLGEAPAVSIPAPHVMEKRGMAIRAALQGLISDALAKSTAARATIQAQTLRTEALTVIFAVAAIVIGIGIAVPSALTLTRPLQRLQARMRSMTEGDLDSAITEGGRADEIGHIAKALHFMRDRLAERRRMEGEAAAAHRDAEQRLHATEAAFAAAGREQAEIVPAAWLGPGPHRARRPHHADHRGRAARVRQAQGRLQQLHWQHRGDRRVGGVHHGRAARRVRGHGAGRDGLLPAVRAAGGTVAACRVVLERDQRRHPRHGGQHP